MPPNMYVTKETIIDEILSSLYESLPPDIYEEYRDTIIGCLYENEQRNIIINTDENTRRKRAKCRKR